MSSSDTLINTLFDGRYRIVRKLGSGGMANVYLAEDEDLGRRVAIKILNDRYANDDLFIERFRREAKSAAALSHPNIVSVYDRGEAEGTYYIAMEVIEGRSLKELIMTRGPLPIPQALAYTHEMLEALRFAHRHGIIHRDIKPHNILIGERLKVTDFGIARAGASQMTEAGSIMGTAQYLSPEQARGAPVTAASDLYSVGIVLYEMLTGKVPFTGDSAIEIAMKHLNEPPKPPSKIRPEISEELDAVVLRALSKNPEDRYQTAEEFSEDLHRVEAGLPLAPETSEAATALLTGAAIPLAGDGGSTEVLSGTAVTRPQGAPPPQAPPRRPPYGPGYYDEPPRKRRRWGPWLLVALLLAAAGIAGWYVFSQIQDQLAANEPVAVPNVVGLKQEAAVALIQDAGLEPDVQRAANADVEKDRVFDQNPNPGTRIQKGDRVTILVSTGTPKTSVPNVRASTRSSHRSPPARSWPRIRPPARRWSREPRSSSTCPRAPSRLRCRTWSGCRRQTRRRRSSRPASRSPRRARRPTRSRTAASPTRARMAALRRRRDPRWRSRSRAARARRRFQTRSARTSRWPSTT
jgi:serine/threonine-protein kinase